MKLKKPALAFMSAIMIFFLLNVCALSDGLSYLPTNKAYMAFMIDEENYNSAKLRLNVMSDSTTEVDIYASTQEWDEYTINWNNAPEAGTYVGGVTVSSGAADYELDVSDFLAGKTGKVSFVAVNRKSDSNKSNFDDKTQVKAIAATLNNPSNSNGEEMFAIGGVWANQKRELSAEKDHTTGSGKSFYLENGAGKTGRIKLYNTFENRPLVASDIGKTYDVSFWCYNPTDYEMVIKYSYYSAAAGDGSEGNPLSQNSHMYPILPQRASTILPSANSGWQEVRDQVTISADMVARQACMLGFNTGAQASDKAFSMYFDDINVSEINSNVLISSREGIEMPELIFNDSSIKTPVADSYIESGKLSDSNFGSSAELKVGAGCGELLEDIQVLNSTTAGTVTAGEKFTCTKTVKNNTNNEEKIALITAVYDENDKMVQLVVDSKTVSAFESIIFTNNIAVSNMDLQCYGKVMLINMNTFKPVTDTEYTSVFYDPTEVIVHVLPKVSGDNYSSFDIYVKGSKTIGNTYTKYRFRYENKPVAEQTYDKLVSTGANVNLYRVKTAYFAKRTGEETFEDGQQVLQEGEIELAVREKYNGVLACDFVGGYHGDENLQSVALKADGAPVSLTDSAQWIKGKRVELVQNSLINRCNTPDVNIMGHLQEYKITKEGIELHQKVNWLVDTTIAPSFPTMFTVMRTTDCVNRITDYAKLWWSDGTVAAKCDMTDYAKDTMISTGEKFSQKSLGLSKADNKYVSRVELWNESGDVYAEVERNVDKINTIPNLSGYVAVRIYGDNKVYLGTDGADIKAGDLWEITNKYNIVYKK